MNILITNLTLSQNSGTELYVKELAQELINRGHQVEIFVLTIGKLGCELIEQNINVVNKLSRLKNIPNIIHAHHNLVTLKVAYYFKQTPIVYFIHDSISSLDHPFYHKNIMQYIAVDYNCKQRYLLNNFLENEVKVIYNWFNPNRFKPKTQINNIAKKALIFSNYLELNSKIYHEIKCACDELNISLNTIGLRSGNPCNKPELELYKYDLVFAKAKAGIESMACGCALIVCDFTGLGVMVASANIEECRKYNFGMKLMDKPVLKNLLLNEMKKYDKEEIEKVQQFIQQQSNYYFIIDQIEQVYQSAMEQFKQNKFGNHSFSILNTLYILCTSIKPLIATYLLRYFPALFYNTRILYRKLFKLSK